MNDRPSIRQRCTSTVILDEMTSAADKMRSTRLLGLTMAATLWLGACTPNDSSKKAVETFGRDSAGVRVVNSDTAIWPNGSTWQISPDPLVAIGVAEGPPENELFMVWSAIRLPSREIVVGNAGTREMRTYDSRGRFVRRVGRAGGGPGEFQDVSWLGLYRGDSIAVFDHASARITIFDSESRVGRTVDISGFGGRYAPRATDPSGEFLLFNQWVGIRAGVAPVWDSTLVIILAADGRQADTLGSFPKALVQVTASGRPEMLRPIGAIEGIKGGFLHWRSDQYEVREFDRSGQLRRVTRRTTAPEPITQEYWEMFKADYYRVALGSGELTSANPQVVARRIQEGLDESSPPEFKPLMNAVHEDADGNLWVKEEPPYQVSSGTQRWSVFDPARRWLGHVTLPSKLHVLQIGDDFILGRVRDADEVEQVLLYGLEKG